MKNMGFVTPVKFKAGLQAVQIKSLVHNDWLASEMRVRIHNTKAKQYAKEKKAGAKFPPPVVFLGPDEIYRVGDGFHRVLAEKLNGTTTIEVDLRAGTLKNAVLWNLKANRDGQGLLFSHGDFTRAVKYMLTSDDFKGWTNRQISEAVGCTPGLVSRVTVTNGFRPKKNGRRPVVIAEQVVEMLAGGMTHKEAAEKLGVHERTIYRREISDHFMDCPMCHGSGKVLKKSVG